LDVPRPEPRGPPLIAPTTDQWRLLDVQALDTRLAQIEHRRRTLPELADLSPTYFVKLELHDAGGKLISENFYWLSSKGDTLDKPKSGSDWYYTPTKQFADFTALNSLPPVKLKVLAKSERSGGEHITHVTVENPSKSLAFMVHLKVNDAKTGEEFLPVIWQDNYFSLLPGEKRDVTASYTLPRGMRPSVEVQGWNIEPQTLNDK